MEGGLPAKEAGSAGNFRKIAAANHKHAEYHFLSSPATSSMGGLVVLLTCSFAVSNIEHAAKSLLGTEMHPGGARGQTQIEWGERYKTNKRFGQIYMGEGKV